MGGHFTRDAALGGKPSIQRRELYARAYDGGIKSAKDDLGRWLRLVTESRRVASDGKTEIINLDAIFNLLSSNSLFTLAPRPHRGDECPTFVHPSIEPQIVEPFHQHHLGTGQPAIVKFETPIAFVFAVQWRRRARLAIAGMVS